MDRDIHDPDFVRDVFDRCSANYRMWSEVASFGFVARWRRQCVQALDLPTGRLEVVADLMAGTGEIWPRLLTRLPEDVKITAVDISRGMHRHAMERLHQDRTDRITHLEVNFLDSDLPDGFADCAVSSFGLKTLSPMQQAVFARELARILRPGGTFSLVEAADPKGWALRPLYRLYLDRILPVIERLFLRGAQDFSMLGVYTRTFGDCRGLAECLRAEGLKVSVQPLFFGCAMGVTGCKPEMYPVQA